jgi:type II secretory pathway pseudopilin PulG
MPRASLTRRGTTLLETVVAVGLLATGLSLTAQVLAWNSAQRRANQQRQCAVQEAANCLERLRLLPWDELTAAGVQDFEMSAEAAAVLPQAKLKLDVRHDPAQRDGKRMQIQIQWTNRAGQPVAPVRLTAWRWNVD